MGGWSVNRKGYKYKQLSNSYLMCAKKRKVYFCVLASVCIEILCKGRIGTLKRKGFPTSHEINKRYFIIVFEITFYGKEGPLLKRAFFFLYLGRFWFADYFVYPACV